MVLTHLCLPNYLESDVAFIIFDALYPVQCTLQIVAGNYLKEPALICSEFLKTLLFILVFLEKSNFFS